MANTIDSVNGTGFRVTAIRQKVMDYLYYSVIQAHRVPTGAVGTCADTCGAGIFK